MLTRKDKMIFYRCDLCKQELANLKVLHLSLMTFNESIVWDLCNECIPKIKETLGNGRIINRELKHKK